MARISTAFFLTIFLLSGVVTYFFSSSQNIVQSCILLSDIYIPISGCGLFISLIIKKQKKTLHLFPLFFIYIIFITGSYLSFKEFFIPWLQKKTNQSTTIISAPYISLEEFDNIDLLPSKSGLIIKENGEIYIFGKIARQNCDSYLIINALLEIQNRDGSHGIIYAQYAKIVQNTLIFYKSMLIKSNKNTLYIAKELPKDYQLPISFHIESLFDLWNVRELKNIKVIPPLLYKIFDSTVLLPLLLAISQYLVAFITLCILYSFGITMCNSLTFLGIRIFGSLATLSLSYPASLLIYYYLSLLMQSIINHLIKY